MFTILKLIPHSRRISLQLYPPPISKKNKNIKTHAHRNSAGNDCFDIQMFRMSVCACSVCHFEMQLPVIMLRLFHFFMKCWMNSGLRTLLVIFFSPPGASIDVKAHDHNRNISKTHLQNEIENMDTRWSALKDMVKYFCVTTTKSAAFSSITHYVFQYGRPHSPHVLINMVADH